MDPGRLTSLHRYGAVLSLVAVAAAVVAFLVGGADSPAGLYLGLFGSLGGFYFVGAALSYSSHPVLGEEFLRGVAWYFVGLVGWSYVLASTDAVPETALAMVALPALTALGLALAFVGVRRATGRELQVQSAGGQLRLAVAGSLLGAVAVCYLVLVEGRPPLLLAVYALATVLGVALWWRHWWTRQTSS